jgi:hypothetical protein
VAVLNLRPVIPYFLRDSYRDLPGQLTDTSFCRAPAVDVHVSHRRCAHALQLEQKRCLTYALRQRSNELEFTVAWQNFAPTFIFLYAASSSILRRFGDFLAQLYGVL